MKLVRNMYIYCIYVVHEKLYLKTGIRSIRNKINEVGGLKCRIDVHSAASAYSCIAGDP